MFQHIFKVPRNHQQFPYIPFLFGAYESPPTPLWHRLFSSPHQTHLQSLYLDFVSHYFSRKTDKLVSTVAHSLLSKCETSLIRLESAGVSIHFVGKTSPIYFQIIHEKETFGTKLLFPELEPPPDFQPKPKKSLPMLTKLKKVLKPDDDEMDLVDYLASLKLDLAALTLKRRGNGSFSSDEFTRMSEFWSHLKDAGTVRSDITAVCKLPQAMVLRNKKGEEIDGETEPNFHILHFSKVSTQRMSIWLQSQMLLDYWFLTDVDYADEQLL